MLFQPERAWNDVTEWIPTELFPQKMLNIKGNYLKFIFSSDNITLALLVRKET